jgi:hypothetical protein
MENSRRKPPRAGTSLRNCDEHLAEYAETIDGAGVGSHGSPPITTVPFNSPERKPDANDI